MRMVSGVGVEPRKPTGFSSNEGGVASDDLLANPMSGLPSLSLMLVLADTVDSSIPHQGVSGNDTGQAPPRVCFTCDAQLFRLSLFVFNNCCQISGANAVPWVGANTNGANHKISDLESPTPD